MCAVLEFWTNLIRNKNIIRKQKCCNTFYVKETNKKKQLYFEAFKGSLILKEAKDSESKP